MEARTQDYGSIGWAVSHLRLGWKLKRAGWKDGRHVTLVNDELTLFPVASEEVSAGAYQPKPADLLARDWQLIDAPQPGHTSIP